MPARSAIAAMLCLAFALTLAACGGSGLVRVTHDHQHWTFADVGTLIRLEGGNTYYDVCTVLQENVSKEKHSSRTEHDSDYTANTFVVTSKSTHYPAKSGDKFCYSIEKNVSFIQTKEHEAIIQASTSSSDGEIDYGALEHNILVFTAALGKLGGFKYGVFDNTEERVQEKESEVTGSRSTTIGSETGAVTSIYNSTYGVQFGDAHTTTHVERTPGKVTVNRKHSVRYYKAEPDTDGYFDIGIVLKSLNHDLDVIEHGVPNAKYCDVLRGPECDFFDSDRKDFSDLVRR